MSIQDTSKGEFNTILSIKAGVTVNVSALIIATPRSTTEGESSRNSKTLLQGNNVGYQGNRVVYYDRLNLADLGKFTFVKQPVMEGAKLYDIFPALRDQTGIRFTTDDLEDATVMGDGEGNLTVLLKAKSGSLAWVGEYTLSLGSYPHISTAFSGNTLNGF